jgi:energy-converting hydrogenase Eha subunit G
MKGMEGISRKRAKLLEYYGTGRAIRLQHREVLDDEKDMQKVFAGILVVGGIAWILWTHAFASCCAMLHIL